jgi:DNA-binding NtrC family response regulator
MILLCDGEDVLRRATAIMLKNRGGRVRDVASVGEALEMAADHLYDVAIFDVTSRTPTGAAILSAMRERGCLPRRVIVCVDGPKAAAIASEFAEVVHSLQKPYAFDRLLDAVFGPRAQGRTTRSGIFARLRPTGSARSAAQAPARFATVRGHSERSARTRTSKPSAPINPPRRAVQVRRGRV